ncbi:MAG: alpha/beta hydrolase [Pseudomonadota bacterium]
MSSARRPGLWRLWVAGALLMLAATADARLGDRLRDRQDGAPAGSGPARVTIGYGSDALQRLDVWQAGGRAGAAPLVLFVHGGAWKHGNKDNASSRWLPAHLTQQGYAYASIDYRLVPAVTVEQQAEDVAHALKALLDRAPEFGIDRRRVVLMGHSAGAHLVALVGTDERYLQSAGLRFADVAGVIANDGAAYDVPAQMQEDARLMHRTYAEVFGTDPARQRALSPTAQAVAPNVAAFLLLHVQRPDGVRQATALGHALTAAGTTVERREFPGEGLRGHVAINRELGDPDYPATAVMDAWLRQRFGK